MTKGLFTASLAAAIDWAAYGLASLGCALRRRHEWVPMYLRGRTAVFGHYCARCYVMDEDMT